MNKRIIYNTTYENGIDGVAIVIPTGEVPLEQLVEMVIPAGTAYEIVDAADIPSDRTFRNAWKKNGTAVETDIPVAKEIAHEVRRADRTEKMKPLDVEATIPAMAEEAEAARQVVRDENAAVQIAIDAASDEAGIKAAIGSK